MASVHSLTLLGERVTPMASILVRIPLVARIILTAPVRVRTLSAVQTIPMALALARTQLAGQPIPTV